MAVNKNLNEEEKEEASERRRQRSEALMDVGMSRLRNKAIQKEKRKPKQVYACPHTDKPFYAKGFCQACYHSHGRTKLANNCDHRDKPNHALGLCKNCYFSQFARKKRQELKLRKMTQQIAQMQQQRMPL